MQYKGLDLYPFQEDAIRAIDEHRSVIVSAPTGAGKTIIAEFAIDRALAADRRVVYTSPIKALSNQKYRDFTEAYGDRVGIMTGDVTINPDANIQVMTTEIFRNTIFEDSSRLQGIDFVVFDEVHYLGDSDRGSVWEESIIFAPPEVRFVALSATIGNLDELRAWMSKVREEDVALIHTDDRPVPLHRYLYLEEQGIFEPRELKDRLREAGRRRPRRREGDRPPPRRNNLVPILAREKRLPILYFCFSRRRCEQLARNYQRKLKLFTREESRRVTAMFDELVDRYEIRDHPAVGAMRESVSRGILYHHAGMLPVYKDIVERLFTSGLVKLIFTTETFALGVNMPARCVIFDSLHKFNGVEVEPISPLDFRQMAGRAGRQGKDSEGDVYCILDPEVDTAKIVGEIIHKKPGAIRSRFDLGYSTILNLHRLMGRDIAPAVEKSFAAFQRGSTEEPLALLRARLRVLEERQYLGESGPTGKGRFCARLAGFEVHLTELYWDGCFEDLDPVEIAMVASAIVHSPRPRDRASRVEFSAIPDLVMRRSRKRIREFRRSEMKNGILDLAKHLDFGLAPAIEAWSQGADFARLARGLGKQDGDLVRALRLTIQVLRQLAWALPKDNHVAVACRGAIEMLNRDEVDAEAQLRRV
ncbi:MAG: DEAD/DEAH box helicase [Planctomycetota bacterium]